MLPPINLQQWIQDNQDFLKPPVCNKQVYAAGDFMIMVVGGPNSRKDYHDDPGEEFFYQIKGDLCLRLMENGQPRDVIIKEGELFLLQSHVFHSPQRFADTIGLVIERKRAAGELDGFLWFCGQCHHQLHSEYVPLKSIVEDLPPLFKRFWDDEHKRTCKNCGQVMPLPGKK